MEMTMRREKDVTEEIREDVDVEEEDMAEDAATIADVDTVEAVEVAVTEIEEATGEVAEEIVDNMMIEEMIDLVEGKRLFQVKICKAHVLNIFSGGRGGGGGYRGRGGPRGGGQNGYRD